MRQACLWLPAWGGDSFPLKSQYPLHHQMCSQRQGPNVYRLLFCDKGAEQHLFPGCSSRATNRHPSDHKNRCEEMSAGMEHCERLRGGKELETEGVCGFLGSLILVSQLGVMRKSPRVVYQSKVTMTFSSGQLTEIRLCQVKNTPHLFLERPKSCPNKRQKTGQNWPS